MKAKYKKGDFFQHNEIKAIFVVTDVREMETMAGYEIEVADPSMRIVYPTQRRFEEELDREFTKVRGNCFSGVHYWIEHEYAHYCCNPWYIPVRALTRREFNEEKGVVGIHPVARGEMFSGWKYNIYLPLDEREALWQYHNSPSIPISKEEIREMVERITGKKLPETPA